MGHLCPSKLCHGWDKMDLDTSLAGHRGTKSHQELWWRSLEALGMAIPAPGCCAWTPHRPWTALFMGDAALWSRTTQDALKMIPPCPGWNQKAAFGLVLGLMGISCLLLKIYILYVFIVCIYTMDVGNGLRGICWDGAQKMGVDGHPRSCRDTWARGEPWIWGLSFANAALGPPGQEQQSHEVLALDLNPKSSGSGKCRNSVGFGCWGRDLM